MKRKRIIILVLLAIIFSLCYIIATHLGVNITPSVPFRVYFHTDISKHQIVQGDYIVFNLKENELYPQDTIVVKRIACAENQFLKIDGNDIYCDGYLISDKKIMITKSIKHVFNFNGYIPADRYFVLGSNSYSYDSRYWGFIDRKNIKRLVHPIVLNPFISTAYAKDLSRFYDDKDRGWYKYEVLPKPTDNNSSEKKYALTKPIIPWEHVDTMHPDDFKKLFSDVENYAMSKRDLSTFDDYAKLRSVLINRSMEFMNVGSLWAQLHPEDTSESWYPTSGYGRESYQEQINNIRQTYIVANKNDFGLLYFFRDDCKYCQSQTPIINYFQDSSTWTVKFINTDMMPEAMARFNVETVPTLILVDRQSDKWLLISSGVMTLDEIEERLYRTIKYLRGDSNEKDFNNPIRPDNFIKRSSLR